MVDHRLGGGPIPDINEGTRGGSEDSIRMTVARIGLVPLRIDPGKQGSLSIPGGSSTRSALAETCHGS
jgi:hypothetical protein